MLKKLNVQDGQAIDLLLDKSTQRGSDSASYMRPDGDLCHHVSSVEKVLGLLNLLPAEEPPADLVQRTLSRIYSNISKGTGSSVRPSDPLGPTA